MGRISQLQKEDPQLRAYLAEISKIPLLSVEQEVELSEKAKRGDDRALQRLVEANLRFVVMVAKEYQDQGLPITDLINEGNLGLMEAARRFDSTRGIKFISYAVWWIRQSILQAIANYGRLVRLPINQVWTRNKVLKASTALEQDLGRDPSIEEIASELKTDSSTLLRNMRLWGRDVSLEDSVSWGDEDIRVVDRLPDKDLPEPDSPLVSESLREEIENALKSLDKREAEVLRLFFGIGQYRPLTLGEIGEVMHLSRERIRQIKDRALRRLRHISRSEKLRPYLG
ncbi:MAG: sigma-70 family RNA polymerase sigma factor [bacterium]|nr:sigma-70 family RNA polymerase sigma factor [candidate division KSB1 bacterium]MDH7559438.1 sigma-70 family RNA polymerase sigma factor [bacterium]